jgi:hypothetical protein
MYLESIRWSVIVDAGDVTCILIRMLIPLSLMQNVVRHWVKGGLPAIEEFMEVYYFRADCGLLWALNSVKHPQKCAVCGQNARM